MNAFKGVEGHTVTLYRNKDGSPLYNPQRIQRLKGETRKAYEARKKQHRANVALLNSRKPQ